jgi:hypothetical protein
VQQQGREKREGENPVYLSLPFSFLKGSVKRLKVRAHCVIPLFPFPLLASPFSLF